MQARKQSSNPTLCIAFTAPACKHVVHQSVALHVSSSWVCWSEAAMASRSKQASEGKKAAKLAALARAAWNSHVESSPKQHILQFRAENPTYCTQVEKFCLDQFLQESKAKQASVERFCRGRALISKLPPSFSSAFFAKHTGISESVFMKTKVVSQGALSHLWHFHVG